MNLRQWSQEHQTLAALILGLAAALLLEGALLWQLGKARELAARHQPRLVEMERIAGKVRALRGPEGSGGPKFLAAESRFNAEAVDRVARDQKIVERVASSSVKVERHTDQSREQVVGLSVKGLATSQLVNFLRAVEGLDPAVRTRLLVITLNNEKPSLVDAKVEISAYESAATATE